jgi:hypothetical protein
LPDSDNFGFSFLRKPLDLVRCSHLIVTILTEQRV